MGFARLASVARYWDSYARSPTAIVDFRDGGFSLAAGIGAATLAAVLLGLREPRLRKSLLASLLATLALLLGGTAAFALSEKSRVNSDVALNNLDGDTVKLTDYVGKPLAINLWATWCPPCRRELPMLRDAQQRNPDVTFVFVDLGESVEAVKQALQEDGIALDNVLLAPDWRLAAKMGVRGTPTTVFFDATGKRVGALVGPPSAASLARSLEAARAGD